MVVYVASFQLIEEFEEAVEYKELDQFLNYKDDPVEETGKANLSVRRVGSAHVIPQARYTTRTKRFAAGRTSTDE